MAKAAKRQTTIHVDREVYRRLDNICRINKRSFSVLAEIAFEKFLLDMETQVCPTTHASVRTAV